MAALIPVRPLALRAQSMPSQRLEHLDGHRGLAILLVVGYHLFARWPEILPYGDAYAQVWLFKFGWLGVRLFFLVSGFVILMTLERSQGLGEFLWRRWLRLFPAMLVCSLLIYLTAPWLPDRPNGMPTADSLLPGLTLIEPRWWQTLTGVGGTPLEGAFWSLFVEVKFYLFAAAIYHAFGRTVLVGSLAAAYGAAAVARLGSLLWGLPLFTAMDALLFELSFQHFGWFAAGCALYVHRQTQRRNWLIAGLALAAVSAIGAGTAGEADRWAAAALGAGLAFVFAGSLHIEWLRRLLACRPLQFFGFISYPLYLIHENAIVAMVTLLGRTFPVPPKLLPLAPMLLLCAVSYLVARFAEPTMRACLVKLRAPTPHALSKTDLSQR
jgi:peptidoglycan/LPS O-acetylase OafA/YrhL